ncbi:MAG: SAVED domain-containing protein [Proteobacteria bacterium]|nr:SAVED domain-containing protein [Pseudomonadota bacterium]
MSATSKRAIASEDWSVARRTLEERFRTEIEPLRQKSPDYTIVYFGSAPVPLAIQLGSLLGTGATIDIIPRHHLEGTWGWNAQNRPPRLRPVELPEERDRSSGIAIVRVSTSHPVDPVLTREVVCEVPLLEVDIALAEPGEDAFPRIDEMREVATMFRGALDHIGDRFPGVYRVHLFASVQPGMALLLGAQVSSTMHPEIQTYQYARNDAIGAYHTPAILINGRHQPTRRALGEHARTKAAADRKRLAEDLERINGFAQDRRDAHSWLDEVLPGSEQKTAKSALSGVWAFLPGLDGTPLPRSSVDPETCTVDDDFCLAHKTRAWQLDDSWLATLADRLPDDQLRGCALRLLILHEALHRGPQCLTRETSRGVGRFPKVLEEIDYQADLWAMLYERALASLRSRSYVEDSADYFQNLIHIATEAMWAFDDHGERLRQIEVRRLNRYLNWYWQSLRLEIAGSTSGSEPLGLSKVLTILARRPSIELAGPAIVTRNERVFFDLEHPPVAIPELAVYHQGRLLRSGTTLAFDIATFLEALRDRAADRMLNILRAAAVPILS